MRGRVLVALAVAVPLLAFGLATRPLTAESQDASGCPPETPSRTTVTDETVTSFDGTTIAVTVFRPGSVCEAAPVPVVLTLHGWGGSRDRSTAAAQEAPQELVTRGVYLRMLLRAGYGVVSIDARGHGESGGQTLLLHPEREVRDFQAVLDWIHDSVTWVEREGEPGERDIKAAAMGASYGGSFGLMTAAFDSRLDAVIAMVTWNDLGRTLSPHDVMKHGWMSTLETLGRTTIALDPQMQVWMAEASRTGTMPPAMRQVLTESSPAAWMDNVRTPTFLIQGMSDELAGLNEAARNYEALRATGADVWLWAFDGGHVYPGMRELRACASDLERSPVLDFLDAHLGQDEDAMRQLSRLPKVAIATEKSGCVTGARWPVHPMSLVVDVPATVTMGEAPLYVPLLTADTTTTVAGVPEVAVSESSSSEVHLALVVEDASGLRVLHDQVTAVRLPGGSHTADLEGVAATLEAGDRLLLRIRAPAATMLTDLSVSLPARAA